MANQGGQEPRKSPLRRAGAIALRVWLAFHLVAITSWSLPKPPPAVLSGRDLPIGTDWLNLWNERYVKPSIIRPYLLWTGFWQVWDMFSPDPSDTDLWGDAIVTYQNGLQRRYRYPRMYELPVTWKFVKERYRKFYERASQDAHSYLWPVFAQRIALLSDTEPGNPPVRVLLRRHWMPLPKPGNPMPETYNTAEYYEHTVDQQALDRESGAR